MSIILYTTSSLEVHSSIRPVPHNTFPFYPPGDSARPENIPTNDSLTTSPGPRQVEFSIEVIVDEDGSPELLLQPGTEDSAATFYTGSGTTVLTFRSTVQVGTFMSQQQ